MCYRGPGFPLAREMPEAQSRILVVDDEEDLRVLLGRTLEKAGYNVDTAGGGTAALDVFSHRRPDLMVLDLTMPGLDGWEVLERLQDRKPLPPVVLMSGRGGNPRGGRFRDCIRAYLFKPLRASEVVGVCTRILALTAKAAEAAQERRREERRGLIVEVTVLSREGGPAIVGSLIDISSRGFQMQLSVPLKPGEPVQVVLPIPGARSVKLEGRVRWRQVLPTGFLVGIDMTAIDPEEERILRAVLHPMP
jgi:CheY-like chemotaxis protein